MIEYPELEKAVGALPPIAHRELLDFVSYLQYKYRGNQSGRVVKLGGLWAAMDLDVTDEDVRALRQQVTRQLVDKMQT
jgi:hypothetical protein